MNPYWPVPDVKQLPDPAWPLAHRTDLPAHERGISAEAWAGLQAGLASAREMIAAGRPFIDLGDFLQYADDD